MARGGLCFTMLSRTEPDLRAFEQGLTTLLEELVRQDPQPSTLDELFTLVEPWLSRDYPLAREMSMLALRGCLAVFLDTVCLDGTGPSEFSPFPFMSASVVPRCFDSSFSVQKVALSCLQTLIKIVLK